MPRTFSAQDLRNIHNTHADDSFKQMMFDGQLLTLDVHGGVFLLRQGKVLLAWTEDAHTAFRVLGDAAILAFGEVADWVWQFEVGQPVPPVPGLDSDRPDVQDEEDGDWDGRPWDPFHMACDACGCFPCHCKDNADREAAADAAYRADDEPDVSFRSDFTPSYDF